jgi:hypothetical protein
LDEESERGLSKVLPLKVVPVRGVLCTGDEGRLANLYGLGVEVRDIICSGDEGATVS